MNTKEKLQLALGYIQQGHTKGAYARDVNGEIVSAHSPNAVCWCISGACRRATGEEYDSVWVLLGQVCFRVYGKKYGCLPDFNDDPETQLVDIEKVFSVAIALA